MSTIQTNLLIWMIAEDLESM